MAKPIGPICNLDCTYCYYLSKEKLLHPDGQKSKPSWQMSKETLDKFVRDYIQAQKSREIAFAWQGGEPTLLGVDFFRRAVTLQKKYCPPESRITNALQTNGTLLNDEWCEFLHEENFLIGLSIDGPRELHDTYRVNKNQKPTFDKVVAGVRLMKKHRVEHNTV